MEELKPCPFCGGEAAFYGVDRYYVACCRCEARTAWYRTAQEAAVTWNRRTEPENNDYMDGVKYAIYEIFKEADILGSQEIRDSGDTDDGMCARAAERIRAELTATPENKAHGLETIWEAPDRCTYCGEHLAREWSYCPECGRPTEPVKPLTLEQLRRMCKPTLTQLQQIEPYVPIWIVTLADKKISCQITRGLIKVDKRCKPPKEYIDAHIVGLLLSEYGKTWLAYARKPEGSETP